MMMMMLIMVVIVTVLVVETTGSKTETSWRKGVGEERCSVHGGQETEQGNSVREEGARVHI